MTLYFFLSILFIILICRPFDGITDWIMSNKRLMSILSFVVPWIGFPLLLIFLVWMNKLGILK